MPEIPAEAIIVDSDGLPVAHIDRVGAKWAGTNSPDYFGYLCAAALSLMVRNVLSPSLDVAAELGVDLRPALKSSCDDALRDLGGEQ